MFEPRQGAGTNLLLARTGITADKPKDVHRLMKRCTGPVLHGGPYRAAAPAEGGSQLERPEKVLEAQLAARQVGSHAAVERVTMKLWPQGTDGVLAVNLGRGDRQRVAVDPHVTAQRRGIQHGRHQPIGYDPLRGKHQCKDSREKVRVMSGSSRHDPMALSLIHI